MRQQLVNQQQRRLAAHGSDQPHFV
jgi:hypothetical protein